jgi:hypothetical protein
MPNSSSAFDQPDRSGRLSRRAGLQLAAISTLTVVLGRGLTRVAAQEASPVSSPSSSPAASCVADPSSFA